MNKEKILKERKNEQMKGRKKGDYYEGKRMKGTRNGWQ